MPSSDEDPEVDVAFLDTYAETQWEVRRLPCARFSSNSAHSSRSTGR